MFTANRVTNIRAYSYVTAKGQQVVFSLYFDLPSPHKLSYTALKIDVLENTFQGGEFLKLYFVFNHGDSQSWGSGK